MLFNHDTYMQFFEDMARSHVDILHTDAEKHFAEVIISNHPFPSSYLHDFTNNLKSKIKWNRKLMIVESYEADYGEKQDDNRKKWFTGAFLILDEVKKDDIAAQRAKYAECETVAEDIITKMEEFFDDEANYGVMDLSNFSMEKIGPLEGTKVGARVDFKFWQPANTVLIPNPQKWI